ncbi:hypothetical protein EIP91_010361 [Steccherinum ochraceum]|uniref:Fungal-type protein kinase domain-containing protein n=1 Tax=Steccherinum ochraceum TaxID=92696 RepID=A0A4R0R0P6_9APHY|nr:hypothetical protein EIP91_010361 [Steccherinum ochraceum]
MSSTPPNSVTSGEAAVRAAATPLTVKHPDRRKGLQHVRNHLDGNMTNEGRYVEVTWDNFMKTYVPPTTKKFKDEDVHIDLENFKVSGGTSSDEKACYPPTCDFISKAIGGGRLECKDIADWPDKSLMNLPDKDSRRADIGLFMKRDRARWQDAKFSPGHIRIAGRRVYAARNCIAYITVLGEVKLREPGFGLKKGDALLNPSEGAERTRGQIADYVTEILTRQHRTSIFTFYIYKRTARIMRWDRTGCIVSEVIDLETDPKKFFEFFFRIAHATDVQLGHDPTATVQKNLANNANYKSLQKQLQALPSESRLTPYIKEALSGDLWPLYQLDVPEKDDPTSSRPFLVRNLSAYSSSPTGRCTKGFIAYDVQEKDFCFLKDSWAARSPSIHSELAVYKRLEPHGIEGIATVRCGGDLTITPGENDFQTTKTQDHDGAKQFLPRYHTRLVLNEIGIPLKDYLSSWELCAVVFAALLAHCQAWLLAAILHRDISDGNVLIREVTRKDEEGNVVTEIGALLIDWDLCKYREELDNGPTQKNRSGTWRFLSALLLNYPLKGNDVADDIEAFMHLLIVFGLRYHDHTSSRKPDGLRNTLSVYDECTYVDGYWVGSETKLTNIQAGVLPCRLTDTEAGKDGFRSLLEGLAQACKTHYGSLDWQDLKRYALPSSSEKAKADAQASIAQSAIKTSSISRLLSLGASVVGPQPTAAATSQAPSLPSAPKQPLLNTHNAFVKIFTDALGNPDAWDSEDKRDDQFKRIEWKSETSNSMSRSRKSTKRTVEAVYTPSPLGQPESDLPEESAPKRRKDGDAVAEPETTLG